MGLHAGPSRTADPWGFMHVVIIGNGITGVTVAREVDGDDGEAVGEALAHGVPRVSRHPEPVEQDDGGAGSAADGVELHPVTVPKRRRST